MTLASGFKSWHCYNPFEVLKAIKMATKEYYNSQFFERVLPSDVCSAVQKQDCEHKLLRHFVCKAKYEM